MTPKLQDLRPLLHALKILRCHGMSSDALKIVYKSVMLTKLLYAAAAWWG